MIHLRGRLGSGRELALKQLEAFLERVPKYGSERNYDRAGHENVSRLSPWLRHRVLSEAEVIDKTLERYPFPRVEKFVQEVIWRTYWKGWLEYRPQVWESYLNSLPEFLRDAEYLQAIEGRTGIECFDDWVRELKETGYLHNHTRMWFASIWIFTLKLPWQLGAEFFYNSLLDADPASNTLSWRWVGGLQTRGKHYVATPENIKKYSEGRWAPSRDQLNLNPDPLPWEELPFPGKIPDYQQLHSSPGQSKPDRNSAILLHEDDLSFWENDPRLKILLPIPPEHRLGIKLRFLEDLRGEREHTLAAFSCATLEEVGLFLQSQSIRQVDLVRPHCGFEKKQIHSLLKVLNDQGVAAHQYVRAWDCRYHPLSQKGFFPFWQKASKDFSSGTRGVSPNERKS